jgi:hypothetical protein
MRGFTYAILFATALILPAFLITANVLKKESPGVDYTISRVSGTGNVQYHVRHPDAGLQKWYRKKATWIALGKGMKTGSGDRMRTDGNSFVDIMREGMIAIRVEENSLMDLEQKEGPASFMEAGLSHGRILCRVTGKDQDQEIF